MLTPEESALLLEMNKRLRDLHMQRAKAQRCQDRARVNELRAEIDELTEDCDRVMDAADAE